MAGALDLIEWSSNLVDPSATVGDSIGCSMTGWGAVCEGTQTGDPWSQAEGTLHINCLELTAATLAEQAFTKDCSGISILLQLDNQMAVAYINHLGGIVSLWLVQLARPYGFGLCRGT